MSVISQQEGLPIIMACLRLKLAYLMVFGLVQHTKGGIIELKNFHSRDSEPMNDLEVDINSYYTITDGLPHRKVVESLHQVCLSMTQFLGELLSFCYL